MAILSIRLFPDPVLRKRCHAVSTQEDIQRLVDDMIATMVVQPRGIGIAAPQVGVEKRVAVMDVRDRDPKKSREILINPVILHSEGRVISREGCMSLPDYTATLHRAEKVSLAWRDLSGKIRKRIFTGIEAVCLQHELDHLEGKLILDRVACLKTDVIPRKDSTKR